jgi:hypothetical protein
VFAVDVRENAATLVRSEMQIREARGQCRRGSDGHATGGAEPRVGSQVRATRTARLRKRGPAPSAEPALSVLPADGTGRHRDSVPAAPLLDVWDDQAP